ncbi:hypothetical protein MKZ38_001377 [Zalerion maritima]|uniref:Copper-fist domain-containing protein n=1 Tax=Zalerion maritima TaxID=339359 RepID=A0AAD5RRI3_9PEZI|nr:hypothetical protein MKZ38_001377 [Zalerion maritima]
MPLINGQKMACEPCIRGHRSTKCTHAKERLMVPVRKPGRPLSSCPHPPNRNCGCAGVTAAIPRKQKCVCGSATPKSSSSSSSSAVASTGATIPVDPSPMSPSRSTFRIQKPTSSSSSNSSSSSSSTTTATTATTMPSVGNSHNGSSSSKLVAEPSILDRMDPSQINILPPTPHYGPIRQQQQQSPFPYMSVAPTPSFVVPQPAQPAALCYMINSPSYPSQNGSSAPTTTANAAVLPPALTSCASCSPSTTTTATTTMKTIGGCCSRAASSCQSNATNGTTNLATVTPSPTSKTPTAMVTMDSSPDYKMDVGSKCIVGGTCCCGDNGDGTGAGRSHCESNYGLKRMSGSAAVAPIAQFPPALDMYPQLFPAQPTIYTYPPMYGTYLHPLQPSQWREGVAAISYDGQQEQQSMPRVQLAASYGGAPDPVQDSSNMNFSAGPGSAGTTHQCNCGKGCQCIGCAAHPYNEATQKYVRSAWDIMASDGNGRPANAAEPYGNGRESLGSSAANLHHAHGASAMLVPPAVPSSPPAGVGAGAVEGGSPPAAQTPSDTASNDEQALSASDFFFVTYPFADGGCGGDTASCPCGDDCQCLGCTIHGGNEMGGPLPA